MVLYSCTRCGYNTTYRTHMKNHLTRKNICLPILEDVSIEQICFLYDFDMIKFQQKKPALEQVKPTFNQISTDLEQVKPAFTISTGNICKFCKKTFTRMYGLNCHLKVCKIKKENDEKKEKESQQLCLMKNEIDILKEKLDKTTTLTTTNNTISNTNSNTNSNNTQNINIHINNFGEENIKHIDYSYYNNILKGVYGAVPKLVEKIHFDKEHPENQNIKLTNKKEPYIKIR